MPIIFQMGRHKNTLKQTSCSKGPYEVDSFIVKVSSLLKGKPEKDLDLGSSTYWASLVFSQISPMLKSPMEFTRSEMSVHISWYSISQSILPPWLHLDGDQTIVGLGGPLLWEMWWLSPFLTKWNHSSFSFLMIYSKKDMELFQFQK